jgi:hypothetical protein
MEIKFLHEKFTEKDPKLLLNHIQRMASGEAPFFPTTLSLVYGKMVENAFTKRAPSNFGPGDCTGNQSLVDLPSPPQASISTPGIPSSSTIGPTASSSSLQAPASTHGPLSIATPANSTWLQCVQCNERARLQDLYDGLRCPLCPGMGGRRRRRPIMRCVSCNAERFTCRDDCRQKLCRRKFM